MCNSVCRLSGSTLNLNRHIGDMNSSMKNINIYFFWLLKWDGRITWKGLMARGPKVCPNIIAEVGRSCSMEVRAPISKYVTFIRTVSQCRITKMSTIIGKHPCLVQRFSTLIGLFEKNFTTHNWEFWPIWVNVS